MFNGINNYSENNQFGLITRLGQLNITYYGILVVLGFVLAVIVAAIKLKHFYKVSYDPMLVFAVIAFPLGIVGASIWSYWIGNSNAWYSGFSGSGGLAIQGGVFVSTLFGLVFFPLILAKTKYRIRVRFSANSETEVIKRISTWVYFDAIIPVVLIGQALGRWGNFFNYEVFGGMVSSQSYQQVQGLIRVGDYSNVPLNWLRMLMPGVWQNMWIANNVFNTGTFAAPSADWASAARLHHPLFLYESFFNVIIFALIYFLPHLIKWFRTGLIGGLAIIYTGIFRSITEPLRYRVGGSGFSFNQSIVLSALFIVIGILVIVFAYVSSMKVFKFVAWYEFGFDALKRKWYAHPRLRDWSLRLAVVVDNILKTNINSKFSHDIKRLQKVAQVQLYDYVINEQQTKYRGEGWFHFRGKPQFWMNA